MGALVIAVTLGACATHPPDMAQTLWSARTEFVGDNPRVPALADEAGIGIAGDYTLALQTQQAPYAITVTYDDLDKPFEDVDFSTNATLMLGLVANLDNVSVTSDEHSYSLTASDASTVLGFDVKDLGRDERRLAEYVGLARD